MDSFEFTKEWFQDKKNQVSTIQDVKLFDKIEDETTIQIGEHFLLDLYEHYGNGRGRSPTDVEIWEVENTKREIYHPRRCQKFHFKAIRKITMGKQFGYPNGYWKVPEQFALHKSSEVKDGK